MTRLVAVAGYKDCGKTGLCEKLIAELELMGVRTGYIKRTSVAAPLSPADTDTGRVRAMGKRTLLWGAGGIVAEEQGGDFTAEQIAASYFPEAELVIVEGGKDLPMPKVWVCSKEGESPDYPGIFVFYDRFGRDGGKDRFAEGEERAIAERLFSMVRGEAYRSATVYIGDKILPMKDFVADFVRGGIIGMLSSLKGGERSGAPVRVYLDGETKDKGAAKP
jgi:molybdopterin-guanine dinucleotide biosynthesis protein B